MATVSKGVDKWKKKKWYTIKTPANMDNRDLVETPAEKPEQVIGRTIKASCRELSGASKKQNYWVTLKVTSVQGSNASTILQSFELPSIFVKKFIRRRKSNILSVHNVMCSNGQKCRVKALSMFGGLLPKAVESKVRLLAGQFLTELALKKQSDELAMELLFGDSVVELEKSLKKLGSIKKVEFVTFKTLGK